MKNSRSMTDSTLVMSPVPSGKPSASLQGLAKSQLRQRLIDLLKSPKTKLTRGPARGRFLHQTYYSIPVDEMDKLLKEND